MQRIIFVVLVLGLSAFNIAEIVAQDVDLEGNAGCSSLRGCRGSAVCDSPGGANGCYIFCDNGAQIICPTA
jgi:hypothetical protein